MGFESRNNVWGMGTYSAAKSNVTDLRGIARMGFCLPQECTQEDLDSFTDKYIGLMNEQLEKLPGLGINIDLLIFRNYSRLNMQFSRTDSEIEDWQSRTKVGAYVVLGFLSVIVALSLFVNLYVSFRQSEKLLRAKLGGVGSGSKEDLQGFLDSDEPEELKVKRFLNHRSSRLNQLSEQRLKESKLIGRDESQDPVQNEGGSRDASKSEITVSQRFEEQQFLQEVKRRQASN
mmetsp:Transcript_7401/g.12500  ORF Transcript_7401/g.12500 Transcript_7401/m.12500 type:complete len:232 (+) Transcript_7401:291-986(+)